MKVFALNSSARTESESKTELMLNQLVDGMLEAGSDVDVVNLREKNKYIQRVCIPFQT